MHGQAGTDPQALHGDLLFDPQLSEPPRYRYPGISESAELAAMCALAGRIMMVQEYLEQIKLVNAKSAEVYRYLNFDQIPAFVELAATIEMQLAKIGRFCRSTAAI